MDPLARFHEVYARAQAADPEHFNSVAFATVGDDGRPSNRMVLLKGATAEGFVVYTNLNSRKAREALAHPVAALCFYWSTIYEQVRVEGTIELVNDADANAYFATRARGSQIGAWASDQSEPLHDRQTLIERVAEYEAKFEGQPVPRPPHWSGLRIVPDRIEFWTGQVNRLHIRTLFTRKGKAWRSEMLNP